MNTISSTISEYTARVFNKPTTLVEKVCSFISNNRYLFLGAAVLLGGTILYFKFRTISKTSPHGDQPPLAQNVTKAQELANEYEKNHGTNAPTQLEKEIKKQGQGTPQSQRIATFGAYLLLMNKEEDTSSQYETSNKPRLDFPPLTQ